jgi:hypothetical protein
VAPSRALTGLLAAATLGGCNTAVHRSEEHRAVDTVQAFLTDCARGSWLDASRILAEDAARFYIEHSDKAERCADELGLGADRLKRALADTDSGEVGEEALKEAFGHADVSDVTIRGDQAEVEVTTAGISGTVNLEDEGEVYSINTK